MQTYSGTFSPTSQQPTDYQKEKNAATLSSALCYGYYMAIPVFLL